MKTFFTYAIFNLMIFGALLMSYGTWLMQKDEKNIIRKYAGSIFFLLMYLLVIWIQFLGEYLTESNIIILSTQFILVIFLVFEIKLNNHKILKSILKINNRVNDVIEYKIPKIFELLFIIAIFLGILFLIVKLVKYFWYL